MFNSYPILFDETEIKPSPVSWIRTYDNVEEINTTENGIDDIEMIRRGKSTISCVFQCSSAWASKFAVFNQEPMLDVKFYDTATKGYITLAMRMEDFNEELVRHSGTIDGTHGLYNISFNLVEY